MARRAAAPPPWLVGHTPRLSAAGRDVLLVEAEATLAQLRGFLLIPYLAQAEGYFREIAPHVFPGCDVDQEWDLLAHRQAHQPAAVTRLLEVIIDESALVRVKHPEIMAGQLRHLLALTGSPHATVRIIPADAVFYESRGRNFDVLSFAWHHRPDRRLLLPGPRRRARLRRPVLRSVGPHPGHLGGQPGSEPGHPRTAPGCPSLNHAARGMRRWPEAEDPCRAGFTETRCRYRKSR